MKFKLQSIYSSATTGFARTIAKNLKPSGEDWQRVLGYQHVGYSFGFSAQLDEDFIWQWSTELKAFVLVYASDGKL